MKNRIPFNSVLSAQVVRVSSMAVIFNETNNAIKMDPKRRDNWKNVGSEIGILKIKGQRVRGRGGNSATCRGNRVNRVFRYNEHRRYREAIEAGCCFCIFMNEKFYYLTVSKIICRKGNRKKCKRNVNLVP